MSLSRVLLHVVLAILLHVLGYQKLLQIAFEYALPLYRMLYIPIGFSIQACHFSKSPNPMESFLVLPTISKFVGSTFRRSH